MDILIVGRTNTRFRHSILTFGYERAATNRSATLLRSYAIILLRGYVATNALFFGVRVLKQIAEVSF